MRHQVAGIADVAPEAVLLAAAGRAILLQIANPAVGYGVVRHSDFADDPLQRLHGTLSYVYALTNGTPAQQRLVKTRVQRAHLPIRGAATAGHPAYDASDPALQLWVAATLYDSTMCVYDAVFPPLPPDVADRVYREHAVLGTALGMPAALWPPTRADFADYWQAQLSTLSVDGPVQAVAGELMAARNAPWWIRAAMPLARFLTAGLLPPRVRRLYGFDWGPRRQAALRAVLRLARLAVRVLPSAVRHAPMRHYLRQLH